MADNAAHTPSQPNRFRNALLSQNQLQPAAFQQYRLKVDLMLAQQDRTLNWQKWIASSFWVYVVLLGTLFLILAGTRADVSPILLTIASSFFLLIAAAVELLKYFINRSHLELLRAIKVLEVEMLELKDQVRTQLDEAHDAPSLKIQSPK